MSTWTWYEIHSDSRKVIAVDSDADVPSIDHGVLAAYAALPADNTVGLLREDDHGNVSGLFDLGPPAAPGPAPAGGVVPTPASRSAGSLALVVLGIAAALLWA